MVNISVPIVSAKFNAYLCPMLRAKMPSLVQSMFPRWRWHGPRQDKVLYLTFDDGPSPGITEWVLETLARYEAKATFFCIGDKVQQFPETLLKVQAAGHRIGNHTFNHLNLWKTPLTTYLDNTARCQAALKEVLGEEVSLFRPPYGKMTPLAGRKLRATYEIVMWEVIAGDWNQQLSPERVANNVIQNAQPGSIVVFHDSEKAKVNMQFALERTLAHFAGLGYRFEGL
jgi:peptidoglycan/xylan/chitin deacetylase (PgdA/CDA1 family)